MNAKRNLIRGAIGIVLMAFTPTARAFEPSAALFAACRGDAIRLCSAHLLSMDSVATCLRANKSSASAQCQAQYDAEFGSGSKDAAKDNAAAKAAGR